MNEQPTASREKASGRWPRYEAADLGFRHYWYPVLEARRLGRKPVPVTLLGEKIVLFRDGGKIHALHDRCPHRGVPLSKGRRQFPGTVSCVFHGWTYDLATGELVAALTDGPDSPICGKAAVRVKRYPVEERANLIWVYVGDEPHPPVEEDIPEDLLRPDAVVEPMVDLRKGDWRYAMENACDEAHAKYLHRYALFYWFRRFPGFQSDTRMTASEDGKWLCRTSKPVFQPTEFKGVGTWPVHEFWRRGARVRPGRGAGPGIIGKARLPGIFFVGHEDWCDYQIFVPVDREHHLTLQVSVRFTTGLGKLLWRLRYWTYIRYIHHVMLNRWEDGDIIAAMDCPPERLFRPDVSITGWRQWCEAHARRSPAERRASEPAAEFLPEKLERLEAADGFVR